MTEKELETSLKVRLKDAKRNNEKRGMGDIELTLEEAKEIYYKQGGKCAALGVEVRPVRRDQNRYHTSNRWMTISLDRVDNTKGYTKDNVRITCWAANAMRLTLSVEEAEAQAQEFAEALTGTIDG